MKKSKKAKTVNLIKVHPVMRMILEVFEESNAINEPKILKSIQSLVLVDGFNELISDVEKHLLKKHPNAKSSNRQVTNFWKKDIELKKMIADISGVLVGSAIRNYEYQDLKELEYIQAYSHLILRDLIVPVFYELRFILGKTKKPAEYPESVKEVIKNSIAEFTEDNPEVKFNVIGADYVQVEFGRLATLPEVKKFLDEKWNEIQKEIRNPDAFADHKKRFVPIQNFLRDIEIYNSVLSNDEINTKEEIARFYGVSPTLVSRIVKKITAKRSEING